MKYTKYIEAIERHLDTCEELRKAYKKDNKKIHHVENIYYLCGYVIECSVFYALFQKLNFPKNEEIRRLGDTIRKDNFHWQDIEKHLIFSDKKRKEASVKVLEHIKEKLPKVLLAICDEKSKKNLDLTNDEEKILILIKKWTTAFRYDIDFVFSPDDVLLLHNEVKNIKGQLTKN